MASQVGISKVGISKVLCRVEGKVKYSSIESGQQSWKMGHLELATTATGQVVCHVNCNIGSSKTFVMTNKVKGVVFNNNTPRCVINLFSGANINWCGRAGPGVKTSKEDDVTLFSQLLEELKNGRKKDSRPNSSVNFGVLVSPVSKMNTPLKQGVQSPGLRALQHSHQLNSTPKTLFTMIGSNGPRQITPQKPTPRKPTPQKPTAIKASTIRTSPNPMTTPSHIKAVIGHAYSAPVYEIKDADSTESDEATAEFSPQLFVEEQSDGNKENTEQKRKPMLDSRGKSALQMRKEGGGSLFMASFQEKQLEQEERKENTAPKSLSGISGFYGRGRQSTGYKATDGLLQPRQTQLYTNPPVKRLPGFLPVSQPKKPRLSTNYEGWGHRNIPSANITSQISLQGFSNLGNTCYMNAILQSLLALERFTTDMLNGDLLNYMQKDSLYRALCSLIFAKQSSQSSDTVRLHLRRVKQAISSTAERFSGFMQHDAQEFLCQCLDQLKEDWQKAKKTVSNSPPIDDPQTTHPCPVVRNFEFEVKHSIVCKNCGEVVTKEEQFLDLSLDMPKGSATNPIGSIQNALDQFFREEAIEYACSECECKQAVVKHNFTRCPRIIILHLKRYRFDVDASQNAKVRRPILIPKFLSFHKHRNNVTLTPKSATTPLVNGNASSAERQKLAEWASVKDTTDGKLSAVNGQTKNTSQFSFNSRKRLEFISGNQPEPIPLKDNTSDSSDLDETQRVLNMSKMEAERAEREQERRREREEEELNEAMEQSKQDVDHDKSIYEMMSEEQQIAYALAISAQDSSTVHPPGHDSETGTGTETQQNVTRVQLSDDTDKPSMSHKKRRTDRDGAFNFSHEQDVEPKENAIAWKKFKSDIRASNSSTPSANALYGGNGEVELIENSKKPTKEVPSQNLTNSRVNVVTPIKQTSNDGGVGLEMTEPSNTPAIPTLVDATPIDTHWVQDRITLQTGENSAAKPTYAELKAKEEEELRRATELSLNDARAMSKEEEDALKRAKEISLQEFSESFHSPAEDEEDGVEPMEVEEESDDGEAQEIARNAESGHLPFSYRLLSVVSHIGSTSAVGHYISDVYDSKKTTWLSYDDSRVVRTSEEAVREERQRTGYIFFYVAK